MALQEDDDDVVENDLNLVETDGILWPTFELDCKLNIFFKF